MSKTYITALVIILSQLVRLLGVDIADTAMQTTIHTLVEVGGAIVLLWNRYSKGDINVFGQMK